MSKLGIIASAQNSAPAGYHADAVHFAGASSLLRIASLACTNSDFNAVSFWFRIATAQTHEIYNVDPLVGNNTGEFPVNKLSITFGENPAGDSASVTTPTAPSTGIWHHALAGFDTAAGHFDGAALYLDDVLVDGGGNDFTATLNGTNFVMGELAGQNDGATFDIADFWFAPNQNLTLLDGGGVASIPEATRRKFIDASLKPVYLGANGEIPTGVAPAVFFSGDSINFIVNNGLGGAVTTATAVTDASTSPSD